MFGEIIILACGSVALMGLYSAWLEKYASTWSKREIEIFEEAMERKGDSERCIVDFVRDIKKERGIKKDIVDYVLIAECKLKRGHRHDTDYDRDVTAGNADTRIIGSIIRGIDSKAAAGKEV